MSPVSQIDKRPPQDFDAEQSVLGAIMLGEEASIEIIDLLDTKDFYRETHRVIFNAARDLVLRNEPVDFILLRSELKKQDKLDEIGGIEYLDKLSGIVPSAANAKYYANIVKNKALERRLLGAATNIITDIYNNEDDTQLLIDKAETLIYEVGTSFISRETMHIRDVIEDALESLSSEEEPGVLSEYVDLDKIIGGFRGGQFIVIAARPSVGKTALAINFVRKIALKSKKAVGIFSLEMSKKEVIGRLLASEAHIDMSKFMSHDILKDPEATSRLTSVAGYFAESNIYIDDSTTLSPTELMAKCRRLKSKYKELDLIIVDYLQIMRASNPNKQNREQEIAEISRMLKVLAKEFNIPVIAMSQLNREVDKRKEKTPFLSDMRESGAIEQDADVVMFIHRENVGQPELSDNTADIIVAKNRNGPLGKAKLAWFSSSTSFENLDIQ